MMTIADANSVGLPSVWDPVPGDLIAGDGQITRVAETADGHVDVRFDSGWTVAWSLQTRCALVTQEPVPPADLGCPFCPHLRSAHHEGDIHACASCVCSGWFTAEYPIWEVSVGDLIDGWGQVEWVSDDDSDGHVTVRFAGGTEHTWPHMAEVMMTVRG